MVEIGERVPRLPTLAGYAAMLRAHITVILLATMLGGAAGYGVNYQADRTYAARASIELPDVPTWVDAEPADPAPDRTTIDTTSELVFSKRVFAAVAAATALPADNFEEDLAVSAYPLSRALIITFHAPSPDVAVAGANAAAEQLIKERKRVLAGARLAPARALYDRLRVLNGRARNIRAPYAVVTRLNEVMEHVSDLRRRNRDAGASIIERADSAKAVSKHPELPIATGLVLGLLGGVAYAWWRSGRTQTQRRRTMS